MTDHRNTRQIELTDEADEIGDVAIERVRLLARRFFAKAEPDHIRDDDAPPGPDERPDHLPVKKAPGGVAVQSRTGSPAPSST